MGEKREKEKRNAGWDEVPPPRMHNAMTSIPNQGERERKQKPKHKNTLLPQNKKQHETKNKEAEEPQAHTSAM